MKLDSIWTDTAPRFVGGSPAPLPARASVVVIGGGFTGLSAARALAMSGTNVVLLEAGRVAGEASGRNGGQCNNGLAGDLGGLADRIGLDAAIALYRAFDEGVDRVEAIVRDEQIQCDFVRNGKLKLADKPEHVAKLAKTHELLSRTVEPELRLIDKADLPAEIRSAAFHGGLVFPRGASLHMGRFAVGLAEAAVRHGAVIHEQAGVTALAKLPGGRHRITTDKGTIEADALAGDSLLVAVLAARRTVRESEFGDGDRAGFCMMGACQDCWIWLADGGRLRACTTPASAGLRVLTKQPDARLWPLPA